MHRTHVSHGWILALVAIGTSARSQSLLDPALQAAVYVTGLSNPTGFAFLPDAGGGHVDVLVTEKETGKLQWVHDGVLQPQAALDLAVNFLSERGLLSVALHPNFAANRRVYLYYTASSTTSDTNVQGAVSGNRVARGRWNGTTIDSLQTILPLPALSGPNHDGGVILFGPDRKLYGVIGDLNHSGQLQNIAGGNPPDDTGIIFRIDDDGTEPADNPFFALGGAMRKVYAYGVRNSFGLAFDPVTGTLWDSENGPANYDELNRVLPGFNSGWNQIMGPDARDPQGVANLWQAAGSTYSDPEFSWLATIAPTAVHFLDSDALGVQYRGDLFVGDVNTGFLYRFDLAPGRDALVMPVAGVQDLVADSAAERDLFAWGSGFGVVTHFATGPDGALYASSLSSGSIYRISRRRTSDASPLLPGAPRLAAFPNPFGAGTRLEIQGLRGSAPRRVRIYSVSGRLVRVLTGTSAAFEWDGRDAAQRPVPSGVYLAEIELHDAMRQPGTRLVRLR